MMALVLGEIMETPQQSKKTSLKNNERHRNYKYFSSEMRPNLTLTEYIDRLASFLHVSDSCFVLALIYIDRLTEANPEITIDSYSIHRLCSVSVVLAMKYNDDVILHKNKYISTIVGISTKELLSLERKFIQLMNFDLYVKMSEFKQYCKFLMITQLSISEHDEPILDSEIKVALRKRFKSFGACSCHQPGHLYSSPVTAGKKEKMKRKIKKRRVKTTKSFTTGKRILEFFKGLQFPVFSHSD